MHFRNPSIFTVLHKNMRFSIKDLFSKYNQIRRKHFQENSGTFGNIQRCSDMLRDIKVYWGIFRQFSGKLSRIQTYSELCVTFANSQLCHIQNLAYLELKTSSKTCKTCKNNKHIQSPRLVRTVYSSIFKQIFRDIQEHQSIFSYTQALFFVQNIPS